MAVDPAIAGDVGLIAASGTGQAGDNVTATTIARLRDARVLNGGTATFSDGWSQLVYRVGRDTQTAKAEQSSREEIVRQVDTLRDEVSGISLDEETMHLLKYQRAYEANARFFSAINSAIDTLSQTRATGLAASGTQKTELEREAAAQTLTGLRDAIFDDLNTSFNGIHVFAGTASSTKPYDRNPVGTPPAINPTYQGSSDEAEVDVDTGRSMKVTYNGESLAKGSAANDIFTVFDNLIAAVRGGSTVTTPSNQAGIEAAVADLKTAIERISTAQTRVGTQMKTLEELKPQLAEMKLQAQTRLDKTENVDMAEAISGMTQAET